MSHRTDRQDDAERIYQDLVGSQRPGNIVDGLGIINTKARAKDNHVDDDFERLDRLMRGTPGHD